MGSERNCEINSGKNMRKTRSQKTKDNNSNKDDLKKKTNDNKSNEKENFFEEKNLRRSKNTKQNKEENRVDSNEKNINNNKEKNSLNDQSQVETRRSFKSKKCMVENNSDIQIEEKINLENKEKHSKKKTQKYNKKKSKKIKEDSLTEYNVNEEESEEDDDFEEEKPKTKRNRIVKTPVKQFANKKKNGGKKKIEDDEEEIEELDDNDSDYKPDEKEDEEEEEEEKESDEEEEENGDWEEVKDTSKKLQKTKKREPVIITVGPMKNWKVEQAMDEIRKRINRSITTNRDNTHKTHLLTLTAVALRMSCIGNYDLLKASALSLLPKTLTDHSTFQWNLKNLNGLKDWFMETFELKIEKVKEKYLHGINHENDNILPHIPVARVRILASILLGNHKIYTVNKAELIVLFLIFCRSLGLDGRIVFSFQPISYKALNLIPTKKSKKKVQTTRKGKKNSKESKKSKKITQDKNESEDKKKKNKKTNDEDENSENDFDEKEEEESRRKSKSGKEGKKMDGWDWWVEVFLPSEECWVSVSGPQLEINDVRRAEKLSNSPIKYVVAFNSAGHVKDLTSKYDSDWLIKTSKTRLDEFWWNESLKKIGEEDSERSKEEDLAIYDSLLSQPMPTNLPGFKNHLIYALSSQLLKFEAFYPPEPAMIGTFRDEPVYHRDCVHTLHSREKWLIEGRRIKDGEEPYKLVKPLPSASKKKNMENGMLGIFGKWQTELFYGPQAENGIVPKNKYGNVDLFKPWMLPKGCVHLEGTFYGMGKAAKKAKIDAAPAMLGWEYHKGMNHPIISGWVVCSENKEKLMEAWEKEQELMKQKEAEKKQARALKNWKVFIKRLLIRERLTNSLKARGYQMEKEKIKLKDRKERLAIELKNEIEANNEKYKNEVKEEKKTKVDDETAKQIMDLLQKHEKSSPSKIDDQKSSIPTKSPSCEEVKVKVFSKDTEKESEDSSFDTVSEDSDKETLKSSSKKRKKNLSNKPRRAKLVRC